MLRGDYKVASHFSDAGSEKVLTQNEVSLFKLISRWIVWELREISIDV